MDGEFSECCNDTVQVRDAWTRSYEIACAEVSAGRSVSLTLKHKSRTLEQNAKMWAMLADVSAQVDWYGQKLTSEEWKDVFSAALKQEKVVPGIHGGFVVLGQRTSKMSAKTMAELITVIEAFGAERGVKFKAPKNWL